MANYVKVRPDILKWAIERSGRPIEAFGERVDAWLSGEARPTFRQLKEFANRAMVPYGFLFLPTPPQEELPVPDYRTLREEGVRRPSPNLIDTVYQMKYRQEWMSEYLQDNGHSALPFVGSARVGDDIESLAARIRDELSLGEEWASKQSNWEDSLRFLRGRIEEHGMLIFANGIVGNNTRRKLDPEEFQGFVLADAFAPLIFVNGADFKVTQMFTIAHELAHVWLGESALFDLEFTQASSVEIERYCNAVAAEFLVPKQRLLENWPKDAPVESAVASMARRFKVSAIVVARRAKDAGLISVEQFFEYYRELMQQERQRKGKENSGGDFWRTQNVRIGDRFGKAVIAAAEDGRVSYSDAYELTGLHGRTYDEYAKRLREATGA